MIRDKQSHLSIQLFSKYQSVWWQYLCCFDMRIVVSMVAMIGLSVSSVSIETTASLYKKLVLYTENRVDKYEY